MITQSMCTSFKLELLTATHNFSVDTFKLALYTEAAELSAATTEYTSAGEVSGGSYVAGGVALTTLPPTSSGTTAFADFVDVDVPFSGTARGALVYNSSKSNKAVLVLDFGSNKTVAGSLPVVFPAPDATNAIVRIA